jgi:hypothetical protein
LLYEKEGGKNWWRYGEKAKKVKQTLFDKIIPSPSTPYFKKNSLPNKTFGG